MIYINEIANCLLSIEEIMTCNFNPDDISEDILYNVSILRKTMGKYFSFFSHDELEKLQDIINKLLSYRIDILFNDHDDFNMKNLLLKSIDSMLLKLCHEVNDKSEFEELYYQFPDGYFSDDVTQIINLTYEEIIKDYTNGCFISSISLCGKVLETCLTSLYIKIFNKNPDDEKLGFNAILNRIKKAGYKFHDATISQMEVISVHRNKAVHGTIIIPTRDEARGVISLTKDVMIKVTSK